MSFIARATTILVFALTFAPTFLMSAAGAAEWRVEKVTGEAYVPTPSGQRIFLEEGNLLVSGSVRTGANSRLLLVRGNERMLVGPSTAVDVPKSTGGTTQIYQHVGELLVDVEKRNVPHFSVDTPYLAAVVKGTQFTVSVSRTGSRVDVHRGVVEVTDRAQGRRADVRSGGSASASRSGGGGLEISNEAVDRSASRSNNSGYASRDRSSSSSGGSSGGSSSSSSGGSSGGGSGSGGGGYSDDDDDNDHGRGRSSRRGGRDDDDRGGRRGGGNRGGHGDDDDDD